MARTERLTSNLAMLRSYGDGKWGEDLYRGTNVDGPVTHSVGGWAQKLGISHRDVEAALLSAVRKRLCMLEELRTPAGCDRVYRVIAAELELEAKITRVLRG